MCQPDRRQIESFYDGNPNQRLSAPSWRLHDSTAVHQARFYSACLIVIGRQIKTFSCQFEYWIVLTRFNSPFVIDYVIDILFTKIPCHTRKKSSWEIVSAAVFMPFYISYSSVPDTFFVRFNKVS